MPAETKAARHRRWAANAVAIATRSSDADRDTLLLIARRHLALASKADHGAIRAPRDAATAAADRRPPGAHEVGQAAVAVRAAEPSDIERRATPPRQARRR